MFIHAYLLLDQNIFQSVYANVVTCLVVCECVYVWVCLYGFCDVWMCGFCDVWVCVCVGFVMCGCVYMWVL